MRSAALILIACAFLASCAGHPATPSSHPATVRTSAPPIRVCQAAVDVMARYSYSLTNTQYPAALDFSKTGNSADQLAQSDSSRLGLRLTPMGTGCEISLQPLEGTFDPSQMKVVLIQIRDAAESP